MKIKLYRLTDIYRSGVVIENIGILRFCGNKSKRFRLDRKLSTDGYGHTSFEIIWVATIKETKEILENITSEEVFEDFINELTQKYGLLKVSLCKKDWIGGNKDNPKYIDTFKQYLDSVISN